MKPSLLFSLMLRESRGSRTRFVFFIACLAVGVAAVVAVAGFSAALERGIRTESRQLLAADLAVAGRRPPPEELTQLLASRAELETVLVRETVTLVSAPSGAVPGPSRLVEIKAVGGDYPFYGELELEPATRLAELLDGESTVVAPDLLARLGLEVGDELMIGGQPFTIRGTVLGEPDRLGVALAMGPRVFLSLEGLTRSRLDSYGSRILHRTLIRMPEEAAPEELEALAEEIDELLPITGLYEIETYAEAQPALRRGIQRVERFLGLVALLSLLVGGVGIAQTVRAWLAGRLDAIAVLHCLGLRPRETLLTYLGQTALLGLAGSTVGAIVGIAAQWVVPTLLADLLPPHLARTFEPGAVLKGFALGVGVAVLFSIPPLMMARRVPPARVLRRDAEPLPDSRPTRAAVSAALIGGILGTATVQAGSWLRGLQFTGSLLAAAGVLALAAMLLVKLVGRMPRRRGPLWLRHGIAALARPGAGVVSAIVALGLGVLVVLAMSLVQAELSNELETALPRGAPTAFLIDIQRDQWDGVQELLGEQGATRVDTMPVVTARLTRIGDRTVEELVSEAPEDRSQRWALTREQRLTYADELPADNEVVEGELWAAEGVDEVSVEKDFARDLGIELGDELGFEIQGVELALRATSIRTVDWRTFGLNFFLVVEPGVLERAPQYRVATADLSQDRELAVQDRLAAGFPNVTLLSVREMLDKLRAVLERLGGGVRFLGAFTTLTGVLILAGAVSAGSVRRAGEVALLKTLGVTRWGVVSIFATEYALMGVVAGVIGSAGGSVLAWTVVTRGLELTWTFRPGYLATAVAATVALSVIAGLLASWRALRRRPIAVLRA